jgi:hypothetical protein
LAQVLFVPIKGYDKKIEASVDLDGTKIPFTGTRLEFLHTLKKICSLRSGLGVVLLSSEDHAWLSSVKEFPR